MFLYYFNVTNIKTYYAVYKVSKDNSFDTLYTANPVKLHALKRRV